jgi:hypothetical protein
LRDPCEVFRCVDSERFVVGLDDADLKSVFKGAQLLEALGFLERTDR